MTQANRKADVDMSEVASFNIKKPAARQPLATKSASPMDNGHLDIDTLALVSRPDPGE